MNETIQSSIFGTLCRNRKLRNQTTYTTQVTVLSHGCVTVSITATPDYRQGWYASLRAAEKLYPLLLQREPSLRQQAGGELRSLHRNYWGGEWRSIPEHELVSILRLNHLNFFSDGTIELWYHGGDPFQDHDVRITLNSDMVITEVGLDG